MENIATYYNDIEIQPNHTYYHDELGNVKSVTTILNNDKKSEYKNEIMKNGTTVHKIIELYLKGDINNSKILYDELDNVNQTKVRLIIEEIKNINLVKSNSEISFVTNDNGIKYGGTVDLLTQEFAIDFKTGGLNNKYLQQISAYTYANSRKDGMIITFKDNKLEKIILNTKEIESYYKEFLNKASNVYNIKDEFYEEIENELKVYNDIKSQIDILEKSLLEKKINIEEKLNNEGYKSYKTTNNFCYTTKGRETTTLKKEIKDKLLKNNPEYFKTTVSKPSFIIRG